MNGRDSSLPKLYCAKHHNLLRSTFDTDRNGVCIEVVEPCIDCRSRVRTIEKIIEKVVEVPVERTRTGRKYVTVKPRKNENGRYICAGCSAELKAWTPGVGRPPVWCGQPMCNKARASAGTYSR